MLRNHYIPAMICIVFSNVISEAAEDSTRHKCPHHYKINPCECAVKKNDLYFICKYKYLDGILTALKAVSDLKLVIHKITISSSKATYLNANLFGNASVHTCLFEMPNLRSVHRDTFRGQTGSLKYVTFTSSMMSMIPVFVLRTLRHLKLFHFYRSNCVTDIGEDSFNVMENPKTVHEIAYQHTNISYIRKGAFTALENLRKLYLYNNSISSFSLEFLPRKLTHLRLLSLSYNNLENMPTEVMKNLPDRAMLALNNNRISQSTAEDFAIIIEKRLDALLIGNSLNCDCGFRSVAVANLHGGTFIRNGKCSKPLKLKGIDLKDLNVTLFEDCEK